MAFNDWKKRLEADASKFDDPEARNQALVEQGGAYYTEFMGTVIDFMNQINVSRVSEERKVEVAVGFLRSLVDNMTTACTVFTRRHSEEAEAIIDWHESHIEFFKGLIADLEERDKQ